MDSVSWRTPVRRARSAASSSEAREVKRDGSITQRTFSGPSVSAAIVATSAESIPPDRPSTTLRKPLFAM